METRQATTYRRVQFTDTAHGWAVGDRASILKWGWIQGTRNIPGKWGWVNQGASAAGSGGFDVNVGMGDLFFTDTLNVWVVGGYPSCRVYFTSDGGESWVESFKGDATILPSGLEGVSMSSVGAGWAVGSNGLILRFESDRSTSVLNERTQAEMETSEYFDLQGRRVTPVYGQLLIRRTNGERKASLELWSKP